MHLEQNVSLKPLHTFGIDVKARYFVEARTEADIRSLLNYRHMIFMPILIIGGGSNMLFTKDFEGIVIRINTKGIETAETGDGHILVTAQAGEVWDEFVDYCVNHGWAGIENLSLIPGTVGAAPIQNIGAYGVEVCDIIDSVNMVEIDSGNHLTLTRDECKFGYRDSIFKNELKGKVIVTAVTFKLNGIPEYFPEGFQIDNSSICEHLNALTLNLDYGNIREEISAMNITHPGIADVREAVCRIRRRKLPDPAELGNAGSFFKNPVVDNQIFSTLKEKFPDIPSYPSGNRMKIPAAWLIEQCGWKGKRFGDAGVHLNQPLVLVNYGSATGNQILDLSRQIIDSVFLKFGIDLVSEVNVY